MLIFDQLKKDDAQLRFLAFITLAGLLILLGGLWWVQVVSTKYYRDKLEVQSIRTVRLPPVRGKIFDRDGRVLAENIPSYNISLYMEELSTNYQAVYTNTAARISLALKQAAAERQKELGRKLTAAEKRQFTMTQATRNQLSRDVRYQVTSNLLAALGARLNQPLQINEKDFDTHYNKARAIPLTVLTNLTPAQIAMFEEQSLHTPAMDIETRSVRHYPHGTMAAHLLGFLYRDTGESDSESYYYRIADYVGASGIERLFEDRLRGTAGVKSVLVNNLGYRHGETIVSPPSAGDDVTLTIDTDIQQAADNALDSVRENVHGAVVVMDVRNGDVLAMASAPSFNPNYFAQRPAPEIWAQEMSRWTNKDMEVEMNHAAQGTYAPGSVFKVVVGMAALEQGLDPKQILTSPGYVPITGRREPMRDTAEAGDYDFDRAIAKSCNYYFVTIVTNNPKAGVLQKVIELGQRLHFGERTGIIPHQEDRGYFPSVADITSRDWHLGNTANICIGQDRVGVTPIQVAVMISAVANGGKVFYPRLVTRVASNDPDRPAQTFPAGRIRDNLGVSARTLRYVHEAMRTDVTSPEGSGRTAAVEGMDIAGKTGTAEVEKNGHKEKDAQITWFASFAPVQDPRYAVVVMVEGGASGGKTCAPLAHIVYEALLKREHRASPTIAPMAEIPH